jgi:hypothetical protein
MAHLNLPSITTQRDALVCTIGWKRIDLTIGSDCNFECDLDVFFRAVQDQVEQRYKDKTEKLYYGVSKNIVSIIYANPVADPRVLASILVDVVHELIATINGYHFSKHVFLPEDDDMQVDNNDEQDTDYNTDEHEQHPDVISDEIIHVHPESAQYDGVELAQQEQFLVRAPGNRQEDPLIVDAIALHQNGIPLAIYCDLFERDLHAADQLAVGLSDTEKMRIWLTMPLECEPYMEYICAVSPEKAAQVTLNDMTTKDPERKKLSRGRRLWVYICFRIANGAGVQHSFPGMITGTYYKSHLAEFRHGPVPYRRSWRSRCCGVHFVHFQGRMYLSWRLPEN